VLELDYDLTIFLFCFLVSCISVFPSALVIFAHYDGKL